MEWKEASTLILTAVKNASVKTNWNYYILTLQRSLKSSFMPNSYVFPGGTTEFADSSCKWLDIFSDFNMNYKKLLKINGTVPPIIKDKEGQIPKLLSLKITAIRETFEETGILLCVCKNDKHVDSEKWMSFTVFEDLRFWRSEVQKDASKFINLCQHYNCCPDINKLHLWSNWLTPTNISKKRFDTAFFIASLKENPVAVADEKEIDKLCWSTPEKVMALCKSKHIWLPPPQFYEISRLLQFKDINSLNNFAIIRSPQGCRRWLPLRIKTLNGSVSVLPGDDAYDCVDCKSLTEISEVKMTNEEFRLQSKILHRMEFLNSTETKIIIKNYKPTEDHVLPSEC